MPGLRERTPGSGAVYSIPMLHRRNFWIVAAAVALLAAGSYVLVRDLTGSRAAEPKGPPAVTVTTAAVTSKSVPVRIHAIGNVEPYTTVAVKARVDGQIVGVRFKEGDEVRQGAVLFEIDARPFEASLKQAQANLLKDKALLDRATALARKKRLSRHALVARGLRALLAAEGE